jgi:hypothetical protein
MLLKPVALIDSMSGALDVIVAYVLRNRQISRVRVTPHNPKTGIQTFVRSVLTQCSQGFSALTPAEATAWGLRAAQVKRIDSLGRIYTLTAKALYVEVNAYRRMNNTALTSTVPSIAAVPLPITAVVERVTSPSAGITVTIDTTGSTTGWVSLRLSRPLPGTVRVARKSDVRFWFNPPYALIEAVSGASTPMFLADAAGLFPIATADRIGIHIARLNPDYFNVGEVLLPSVTVAP